MGGETFIDDYEFIKRYCLGKNVTFFLQAFCGMQKRAHARQKVLAASRRRGRCCFATGSDLDPSQPTILAVINQTLITRTAAQITLGFIHFTQHEVNEKLFIYLFIYSVIHLLKMTESGAVLKRYVRVVALGDITETVCVPHL